MNNSYRIVVDRYSGFESQVKYWWFPFIWFQCFAVNTSSTLDKAKRVIETHKTIVLYKE